MSELTTAIKAFIDGWSAHIHSSGPRHPSKLAKARRPTTSNAAH
jgi:hypothetical protein